MADIKKNQKEKIVAGRISVVVGLLVFGAKITAYLLTSSSAIFSDAAESVVHVLATGLALFSLYYAAKPPDKNHLYGHGNIEYFSAGMEGLLIVIAAITIIYEAFQKIIYGVKLQHLGFGISITLVIVVVNLLLGMYLIKKGKKTESLILIADGKHILTDSFTSGGVVIGLLLVNFTGIKLFDPLLAFFVAVNIIVTGFKLIRESIGGLMLESDQEILKKIIERLNLIRKPYWIDIHQLRFFRIVNKLHIDFHLVLPFYLTIKEAHDIEDTIRDELTVDFPQSEIIIHLDYCNEAMCEFCEYSDCSYRAKSKTKTIDWNAEKLISKPTIG